MKTIVVYYFSGTGNTKWTAEYLAECITGHHCRIHCEAIEKATVSSVKRQLEAADQLVIGFPVYGSTAPRPVLNFIQNLPEAPKKGMKLAVFATHAMGSGDTAFYVGRLLAAKGYELRQTRHFVMMNNFHVPSFRFYKPDNGKKLLRKLEKNKPRIKVLAEEIAGEKPHIIGNQIFGHFIGNLQRKYIDRTLQKVSAQFMVREDRCSGCGLCVQICPMENIMKTRDGITFSNNCAVCLRCYSQCPEEAVLIGKGTADVFKYPRFKGPPGTKFR